LPSGGKTGAVDGSAGAGSAMKGFDEDVMAVEPAELVLSVLD
jgi:hypothetical protein